MESASHRRREVRCAPKPQMTPPEISEEEMLQRAGRGDSRAFEQLYDQLAPRLYGLLRQMLHDEKEVEEVLQDGFAQMWERASSYDAARSKALTWATMIVRNKAIDRMRALGRRNRLVDSATLEQATLSSQSTDDESQAGERSGMVRQALSELPKDQRQLIECAFLKGLTHHVISDSLGVPLDAVKTNVRRGLLRLRELLKGGA